MKRLATLLLLFTFIMANVNAKIFTIENPDKKQSPYTGMTRKHWMDAAKYLLEGPFSYVKDINSAMVLPKQEGKSYPRNNNEVPTACMEAMCRTMFLAGPLLKEDPDLTINGIKVGDYYRTQLTSFLNKESILYLPEHKGKGHGGQKLVELGGLAVSLLMAPEIFWEPLPKQTRDELARVFKGYAEAGTIDMNWRFFNMCLLTFLDAQGYEMNTKYLEELLHKNMSAYVGDGWYHDAPLFDYYSMWAFQMYGPLWVESYGQKHYPKESAEILKNLSEITNQYPYMFGRDGKMQMWGRSITYRMGASIPLALTGLLSDTEYSNGIEYGWMRRICSGALLQFIQNPDFMAEDNLPNLGFYGHFEDCLQHYSCRGSVFWMAKIFLSLYLPASNPYWTAKETEGAWTKMKKNSPYIVYAKAPKTMTVNHASSGITEFRNVFTRNSGFYYGLENYNRLAYCSALPWQKDGAKGEVAMSYVVNNGDGKWKQINSYKGDGLKDNGWFCREAEMENDKDVKISMSEKVICDGVVRCDKVTCTSEHSVRMGFYSLPKLSKPITKKTIDLPGNTKAIVIDNGQYQVATIMLDGWDGIETVDCEGLHPEAKSSCVVDLTSKFKGERTLRSIMIVRKSGSAINLKKILANYKNIRP